jgi:hypothetical protein
MSRSEEFLRNRVTETVLARIASLALSLGFSRFALGIFGTGAFPNVRLWDPQTGKTLDLEGRALNPTSRGWKEEHMTPYLWVATIMV